MTGLRRMLCRPRLALLLCAGTMALVGRAEARVFVGFGFGLPLVAPYAYPPPVYVAPPPVYYAPPPPVYYTPPPPPTYYTPPRPYTPMPGGVQSAARQSCYAGAYVCPMDQPIAPGATCWCPGNGGQRVYGQAN
ncbi:MAG: hypothetical protein U1E70_11195 [Acetobacteraceae bacterium]|nr:hypothetical protein [Pseudomonadota bacterium]